LEAHPDWAAVMLFYCAVHAVERLFADTNEHFEEHSSREYQIKARYNMLWNPYRILKSESLKTRYLDGGLFSLTPKKVKSDLLEKHLAAIVADVDARIAARKIFPNP
jgi:hypothetical protein